ncbi:MAG: primosomal protein N' (replication factor Y) - superfamily II helicase [Rhodobacterales bacterium]|nr:MAG: primosomal protein N' (replication factor Y) - superfamily II helicase [Rhodobacterales bacterium]
MTDTTQEHRFPCQQCGADYRFAPEENLLVCSHCGHQTTIDGHGTQPIVELDFQKALAAQLPDADLEDTRAVQCPNCAAKFEFDADIHAAQCPFCATPVVTDTGTTRQIKPRAVLPFAIEERDARQALINWLGGLWFAPGGLQQYSRKGRKLQGVYVPYWTYDADTKSSYTGQRGTVYYETRMVTRNGKTEAQQVAKIRWRPVSGWVARFFDDVLVLATKSLPKRYTDALAPWDLSQLEPYQPEYLAGFQAEGYTVPLTEGYDEARSIMQRTIERDVKFDIGGDRQRIHNIETRIKGVTFKHILLPVWMAAYKYRGKTYRFVINGHNGRVQGQRPYSTWKIAFAVLGVAIVAAGVGYLIAAQQ